VDALKEFTADHPLSGTLGVVAGANQATSDAQHLDETVARDCPATIVNQVNTEVYLPFIEGGGQLTNHPGT
jgi:hypothetical protein